MVKYPYTLLAYSIISFILFFYGSYQIFINHTGADHWLLLLPLISGIGLLVLFFVKRKNMNDTKHGHRK